MLSSALMWPVLARLPSLQVAEGAGVEPPGAHDWALHEAFSPDFLTFFAFLAFLCFPSFAIFPTFALDSAIPMYLKFTSFITS